MKKSTDDKSIYEGLIHRELDALAAMFDAYEEPMYLLIKNYATLANEEDIMECVGECLYGIWDNIEKFDLKGQRFDRWVRKLTYHRAMNLQNKLEKENDKVRRYQTKFENECPEAFSIEEKFEMNETIQLILKLTQSLKAPQREILYRRLFREEEPRYIAEKKKLPVERVNYLIWDGKKKIRKMLATIDF